MREYPSSKSPTSQGRSMQTSDSIGKLALALSKAQSEMKPARKDAINPYFNSRYADLSACLEVAIPALTAHELSVVQVSGTYDNHVTIETILMHSSGEWIRGTLAMKPKDMSPQAIGAAISYGRRYAYQAMVGIADEDDDGNSSSIKQVQQPKQKDNFL